LSATPNLFLGSAEKQQWPKATGAKKKAIGFALFVSGVVAFIFKAPTVVLLLSA
jgi:hypothetical protein